MIRVQQNSETKQQAQKKKGKPPQSMIDFFKRANFFILKIVVTKVHRTKHYHRGRSIRTSLDQEVQRIWSCLWFALPKT
jgi:hypothetical protein